MITRVRPVGSVLSSSPHTPRTPSSHVPNASSPKRVIHSNHSGSIVGPVLLRGGVVGFERWNTAARFFMARRVS
jgi:hypothetical protein